jgi:hypothetical protein
MQKKKPAAMLGGQIRIFNIPRHSGKEPADAEAVILSEQRPAICADAL